MALPVTFTASNGTELNAADSMMVSNTAHTGVMEVQSNRAVIRASPTGSACYVYDEQPASADYDVQVTFRTTSTGANAGVVGRASKTASTFYLGRYNAGNLQLYKFVAGTATQLGSSVAQTISNNTDYTLKLSMSGSTIKVFWDGVEKISQNNTDITAIGYGGIRINSADTTPALDNLDITNMSAGGASGSYAVTTDEATFSGGAQVSPLASYTLTTADATFSGGATTGSAAGSYAVTTDDVVFSGGATGDTSNGTITSHPFKNKSGTPLASLNIENVVAIKLSDLSTVTWTNQATNGGGVLSVASASVVAGSWYLLVTSNADGSACGVRAYQAT